MRALTIRTILAFAALVVAAVAQPVRADDNPSAVLDQIKASGVLKIPVMVGEEPGYIKDPSTGAWMLLRRFPTEGVTSSRSRSSPSRPPGATSPPISSPARSTSRSASIPTRKRGLVVDYLWEPLFTDAWAVLTPVDKPVKTWAELNDPSKTVVAQKGSTMQVVAESLLPKAKIVPVEDRNLALLELQAGRADAVVFAIFDAMQIDLKGIGDVSLPEPILRNPATLAVARQPGNAGFINFLTNWVQQQRSLGLAQGRLAKAWEDRGIDLSILPEGFSF